MSECEAWEYCEQCEVETLHLFSGSMTKGICMECGHKLPPEQKAKLTAIVTYDG